jgi:histidine triad (HIT) family protein
MENCIFCKIAKGEIPSTIIYQDEQVVAFNDLMPQAPQHILILPRKHIATLNDLTPEDSLLIGKLTLTAQHLAKELDLADAGYRLVMNCNAGGGQAVYHIHMHLLGGRQMSWPPG